MRMRLSVKAGRLLSAAVFASALAVFPLSLPLSERALAGSGAGRVVAWGADGEGQTDVPADLFGVKAIAAGMDHSLALKSDGTVVEWGSMTDADIPAGLSDVTAISAGYRFSLALKKNGTVVAWGTDLSGETDVPAWLTGVVAIAAGHGFGLALKSDGTVVAWGEGRFGATDVPAGLSEVVAIAAGADFGLALTANRLVEEWGNRGGAPPDLLNVTAISAGGSAIALKSDSTIVEWGCGVWCRPSSSVALWDVTAVASGGLFSLALKKDGTVVAWGYNRSGQTNVPAGLSGVTAIAAGEDFSLALGSPSSSSASWSSWLMPALFIAVALSLGLVSVAAVVWQRKRRERR